MLNLTWKTAGQTRSLIEKPFTSEAAFEKYIFDNQDILGDIFIIYRQIQTGNKQGIPDMLGVDKDARVCIVELKNAQATEAILPQSLGYAIWAETNPDSIKAIWLESKHKPEDIVLEWDNLDIRIVLVAPDFRESVPRMAGKLGYQVDLIRVRRYVFESDEFLLVETLEEKPQPKVTTTKVKGDWNWDFYESEHGKEATAQFRKAVEAIAALARKKGWDLPFNVNKYYTGFKLGSKVVFNVAWGGTYVWKIKFKLPEEVAKQVKGVCWEFQSYDKQFHEAVLKPLKPENPDIAEIEHLFVAAYRHVSGL